ncbi:NAD(P)H-binding protein [Kutzneria sp. NPDC051319]|uniref:NAD(P)H-binding protein n=1 Tax=Kutzneria sp. NPDC051319 TaxID=3155047 RepID=UPI00341CF176
MILVTGATGHVGAEVVTALAARGLAVRAMTRRPEGARFPEGVEVVRGDCEDAESLREAFEGVRKAFLMTGQVTGSENLHTKAQVRAAKEAGVEYLVKLSVAKGGEDSHPKVAAWHREDERAVTGSGIDYTMLRPGRFMSNTLHWKHMLRRGDEVTVAFAKKRTAPIAPEDIAAVAVKALTEGGLANQTLELSGPEAITPQQELDIVAKILNRRLTLREPTVEETVDGIVRGGMERGLAEALVEHVLRGDYGAEISDATEKILERKTTTFEQWAEKHFKEEQ